MIAVLFLAVVVIQVRRPFSGTGGESRTTTHDVGPVVQGEVVEHAFVVGNDGPSDLVISEVLPSASAVISADSVIPAGGTGQVRIRMDTRNMEGQLREIVKVRFAGEGRIPFWLQLTGRVVLPVQIAPRQRVYLISVKGEVAREELEVINHQEEPLELLGVTSSNPLFQVGSEQVERGRRYRLSVALDPTAPVGSHRGTLTVTTNSDDYPSLEIEAAARVKDVVSTSIGRVDFTRFNFEALNVKAVSRRTVLVEKHEGTDFQVLRATTDLAFLDVEIETQKPGQSFLVHLTIARNRAERGAFAGTLVIETNDPDFPRLELPIEGEAV